MSNLLSFLPYAIAFLVLAALFIFLPKKKATRRMAVILLILSCIFELFIANFHSYHLIGGDYEQAELAISGENLTVTGAEENDLGILKNKSGSSLTLEYSGIDRPVGTVQLELELAEGTNYVDVKISANDVTNAENYKYRSNIADGRIVAGDDRSSHIVLDLSGDVSDLKIQITPPKNGSFTVNGVTVNEAVPMYFSAVRLVLLVLGGMAVYFLFTAPSMKATYGENRKSFRRIALAMTAVFVLGAVAVTWLSMYDQNGVISEGFKNTTGNQISKELVDAFRAGQVSLLDKPSDELLAMENPYDWSARQAAGVSAKWDHLLFDGKYYSYYGIAPVLLLFLPYNLITGYYFPTAEAVLLFGVLGIIFLALLFAEFAEIFCKKIPNSILISTLFILLISCGVWYNFVYDNFYEIAQASGFCFTAGGFFFLLRSRVIGEGRIRYRHIALSTVLFSLSVLCRPTLAVYCFVACIFLAYGFLKHRAEAKNLLPPRGKTPQSVERAATAKYLIAALTPFVLIGGVQMAYNYARFGSVMDFGIQYSLTINDFTRSQYHTDFVMIGIYNFLFAFPRIQTEFPYVVSNFSTLSTNGYYYVANRNAVGIFWRALPSLGYLGVVPAWKSMSKKERIAALALGVTTCVIAPLIIIFSIWESGYGVRYCCDFAWQIILGGAGILFLIYARVAEGQGKSILRHAFTVAAVLALVVNSAMIYDYITKTGHLAADYLRFTKIFDFWM